MIAKDIGISPVRFIPKLDARNVYRASNYVLASGSNYLSNLLDVPQRKNDLFADRSGLRRLVPGQSQLSRNVEAIPMQNRLRVMSTRRWRLLALYLGHTRCNNGSNVSAVKHKFGRTSYRNLIPKDNECRDRIILPRMLSRIECDQLEASLL
jgi:hypothetical protein